MVRPLVWLATALLAAGVVLAGAAWACVPQPLVSITPKASGAAGSQVTVDVTAVNGDVEVRWNSIQGPELAKATGPSFSVPVTVPQVSEGLYAIVVLERAADGSANFTGRAAFLVTGATSPTTAPAAAAPPAKRPSSGGRSGAATALLDVALLIVGAVGGGVAMRLLRRPGAAEPGISAPPA